MKKVEFVIKHAILYCVLIVISILFLIPIFWAITTAFKNRIDVFVMPPKWIGWTPTLQAFNEVINPKGWIYGASGEFTHFYLNSIITATSSTVISVAFGTLSAYVFARFKFKGRDDVSFWILTTRMFPPLAVVIPLYLFWRDLNLLDNPLSLIITYTSFNLPFTVWIMTTFIKEIPLEIEEAAIIDGCSRFQIFRKIVLPLSRSGLVTTALFCLITSWNEFGYALILTGTKARTIPVAISTFVTDKGVNWEPMCAASLLSIAPILIFTLIIQRHLVRGLTLGAIKG
jgi:multiple sugar transport system permease protein